MLDFENEILYDFQIFAWITMTLQKMKKKKKTYSVNMKTFDEISKMIKNNQIHKHTHKHTHKTNIFDTQFINLKNLPFLNDK